MRIQRDKTSWQVVLAAGIAPCRFYYRVWVWDADLDVPWLRWAHVFAKVTES